MLKQVRQKDIRENIENGIAHDLNAEYGRDDWYEFTSSLKLERIAYSSGIYGVNGSEWVSQADGEMYAIATRSCALLSLC